MCYSAQNLLLLRRWMERDSAQLTSENHKEENATKAKGREEHKIREKLKRSHVRYRRHKLQHVTEGDTQAYLGGLLAKHPPKALTSAMVLQPAKIIATPCLTRWDIDRGGKKRTHECAGLLLIKNSCKSWGSHRQTQQNHSWLFVPHWNQWVSTLWQRHYFKFGCTESQKCWDFTEEDKITGWLCCRTQA